MLRETLENLRERLRSGQIRNEDQVRISVVARVLGELGWDVWNPAEVSAGFPCESVDAAPAAFALCVSPDIPAVFVDTCAPGMLGSEMKRLECVLAERYCAIPVEIAVITDGESWNLYAPGRAGFSECRFRTIDILAGDFSEAETAFTSFLAKTEIAAGNAARTAQSILRLKEAATVVSDILPAARVMVTEPPYPRLPEAVARLAADRGIPVTEEEAVALLARIESRKPAATGEASPPKVPQSTASKPTRPEKKPSPDVAVPDYSRTNIRSFTFRGIDHETGTWKEMLVKFCGIVHDERGDDFAKCLSIKFNNKSVFSRSIKDLFGNSPVRIGESEYYVMTNFTANHIIQLVNRILDMFGYPREDLEIFTD